MIFVGFYKNFDRNFIKKQSKTVQNDQKWFKMIQKWFNLYDSEYDHGINSIHEIVSPPDPIDVMWVYNLLLDT